MNYYETTWIAHHGIKGQKWGVRRYQNEDGSLTSSGKKRRGLRLSNKIDKKIANAQKQANKILQKRSEVEQRKADRFNKKIEKAKNKGLVDKVKKIQKKKKDKITDFKEGTELVKSGYKQYTNVLSKYKNVKLKSYLDKSFKKDPKYKEACRNYTNQLVSDLNYGRSGTVLNYVSETARVESRSRG